MKKLPLLILAALSMFSAIAQSPDEPCGQVGYNDFLEKQYPGFRQAMESQFEKAKAQVSMNNQKLSKRTYGDTIFRIPVVFHVVYNTSLENIPDSLMISQIRVLNEAYRRQNPDTLKTRDIFKPVAADAGIEFYLATVDPFGGATNGITRTETNVTSFYSPVGHTDEMKYESTGGKDVWDPGRYLNIWVCDLSTSGVYQLLGYAFPPTDAQNWAAGSFVTAERQGVVLDYKVVGERNSLNNTNFSKGRTAVHEVGHYLGLRHIWGDGTTANGCNVDDGIDDTPISRIKHNGCNYGVNTCNQSVSGDLPDQIENYMDYTNDSCMNMFTSQQVAMMRYNLVYLRTSLGDRHVIPYPKTEKVNIALFPNPAKGQIVLLWDNPEPDNIYKVVITDLIGQSVVEFKDELQTRNEYHIGQLSSGMYYFQVFNPSNKKVFAQKLMIINN